MRIDRHGQEFVSLGLESGFVLDLGLLGLGLHVPVGYFLLHFSLWNIYHLATYIYIIIFISV